MQFKINLTAGVFWFIILIRVLTFETWNVIFTNYLLKYTQGLCVFDLLSFI